VWRVLVTEMPALSDYERAMSVAVNADYSRMSATVSDGDEVAFLPPVSGG
jgi:molybdopterin converting factor small subunit